MAHLNWVASHVKSEVLANKRVEETVRFRSNKGDERIVAFQFGDKKRVHPELAGRIEKKIHSFNLEYSDLNRLGEWFCDQEVQEIANTVFLRIRTMPTAPIVAIAQTVELQFPDSLWRVEKLIERMPTFLRRELGYVPSWSEFKTYVIENLFEGVDG